MDEESKFQLSLPPGLFARIRIPRGEPLEQLVVPEAALMADQRGRFLYVVKEDNTVEYCPVTVGGRIGTRVAIENCSDRRWPISSTTP